MMNRRKSCCLIFYFGVLINTPRVSGQSESVVSEDEAENRSCRTPGCYEAATLITENLDESVEPCDNFYEFACGGFIKRNEIPEKQNSVSRMDAVINKVKRDILLMLTEETRPDEIEIFRSIKNYFKACMDTDTIDKLGAQPMLDIIKQLGGWPVVDGDSWNEDDFDLLEIMIKLRKIGYQHKYLVNIFVFNDVHDTSSYQLYIEKLETYLTIYDYEEDYKDSAPLQAYLLWMTEIAVTFGADRDRASKELEDVVKFEKVLAMVSYARPQDTEEYEISHVADLESHLPWFPWLSYLNNLSSPFVNFTSESKVFSDEPYYLELLESFLHDVNKRTLANYLVWRAVADSIPHLSKDLNEIKENYYSNVAKKERWEYCIDSLNDDNMGLPIGISSLYVRKYFNNDTRKEVREIVHSIANQFQERLQKVPWLDENTKTRAYIKSQIMKQIVGHPDEMLNDQILENYSKSLEIDPKSHFNNILNVRRFQFDNSLSTYHVHGNYDWSVFSSVTQANALYYRFSNSFVILAGILRRPLFHPDWPSYAKYGSIGFIIGHEMMHAYDWGNFKYDQTGSLRQWYSNESAAEYRRRLDCFEKQYDKFRDENVDMNVDGRNTLNENIADNVGLKVAYSAFKSNYETNNGNLRLPGFKYTPDQLFWIYSVNFLCSNGRHFYRANILAKEEHAPDDFRALGEMINSVHFAESFHCPEGSPMNPKEKCSLV